MRTEWWIVACFLCLYVGAVIGLLIGAIVVPRIARRHGIKVRGW